MVGDLSQALHIMLICERCWGSGSVFSHLGEDECPGCQGRKSVVPNALKYVERVAKRCEELTLETYGGSR